MTPVTRERSRLRAWSLAAGVLTLAGLLIASTSRLSLFAGRTVHAQGTDEVAKNSAGSPTIIEEVRGLVRDLEAQAEVQRSQMQKTEAGLRRARAILDELERGRSVSNENRDRPASPLVRDPSGVLREKDLPEQSLAERTPWSWPAVTATPEACARGFGGGYEVEIVEPKEATMDPTIRVRKDGEEIVAWRAHRSSVFVRGGDLLYYADFSPHATGCRIVAYHLKAREESWKTPLLGIGPVSHSMYGNRVNLKLEGDHLIVYGDEAAGRYIEVLDRFTGRTVGHRGRRGERDFR
jgi:hypothetical protein